MTRGIELAGGPTVSKPVQLWVINNGSVQQLHMVGGEDLQKPLQHLTVDRRQTRLAAPRPIRANIGTQRRSAVQLFA